MKIILLGYMGSGKSTVAKELASALDLPFIDLDDYIIDKEKKSIKEIFETKGEIYFRLQESKYLKELLDHSEDTVLALGGGTPCYGNNMELIKKESLSVYLKGGIATICQRLKSEKQQRPLIASLNDEQLTEFVAKHLFERRNFYEQAAESISIDNKSVYELLQELLVIVKKN
jgi:shikimate kinase